MNGLWIAGVLLFAMLSGGGNSSISQQVTGQDLDVLLERADKLLEEAKSFYEEARAKSSVNAFVEAGFKLEEARIKYLVLQEIGSTEKQKTSADRLRSVNQLSKLIHDGKVAITGKPAEPPKAKPAEAGEEAPPANPAPVKPVAEVMKRSPVPDASRQREAEKQVKELFREEYSKKTPADRKKLARLLLEQTGKSYEDPAAVWVLCRESQDLAVQTCDIPTLTGCLDLVARYFDVDPATTKAAALTAAARSAKAPEESALLADALLAVVDDLAAADLYDAADKAAATALQHARKASDSMLVARASTRSKEVAEAKMLFQAMKGVLQTLAKSPEDPAANLEMGQYLCYVKGSWDLGLRFMAKGSDAALKSLAEKELSNLIQGADWAGVADGWWDLAEKEKSPLRKSQLYSHAKFLYEAVPADAPPLIRARITKRLSTLPQAGLTLPYVDLLPLINLKKDVYSGAWKLEGGKLISPAGSDPARFDHLRIPYMPPAEYDLRLLVEWKGDLSAYSQSLDICLVGPSGHFSVVFDAWGGGVFINAIDNAKPYEHETAYKTQVFAPGKPRSIVCSVRRGGISVSLDGTVVLKWSGDMTKLKNTVFAYAYGAITDHRCLSFSTWVSYQFSKIELVPISGQGKSAER
jgi:hypothetical protein